MLLHIKCNSLHWNIIAMQFYQAVANSTATQNCTMKGQQFHGVLIGKMLEPANFLCWILKNDLTCFSLNNGWYSQ